MPENEFNNKMTIELLNEVAKKIGEEQEKHRTYPIVIYNLKDETINTILSMREEAHNKYGLEFTKIENIDQFIYHLDCKTYWTTPVLFAPGLFEFITVASNNKELMEKGKIFTAVYDPFTNKINLYQENATKK